MLFRSILPSIDWVTKNCLINRGARFDFSQIKTLYDTEQAKDASTRTIQNDGKIKIVFKIQVNNVPSNFLYFNVRRGCESSVYTCINDNCREMGIPPNGLGYLSNSAARAYARYDFTSTPIIVSMILSCNLKTNDCRVNGKDEIYFDYFRVSGTNEREISLSSNSTIAGLSHNNIVINGDFKITAPLTNGEIPDFTISKRFWMVIDRPC